MPGRPRMRELCRDIDALGGPDWVMDRLADGVPVGQVASELGVSRRYLYMWRDRPGHRDELREKWSAAMRMSAEAEVERISHDFDRLDRVIMVSDDGEEIRRVPESSEVTLATGRAKYRMWLAARKDPERFGEQKPEVAVSFSIGDLHLGALQSIKARDVEPAVLEAEVIEDEPEPITLETGGLLPLLEQP